MEEKQTPDEDPWWPHDLERTKLALEVVELALSIIRQLLG